MHHLQGPSTGEHMNLFYEGGNNDLAIFIPVELLAVFLRVLC
jgi:hypothetical protein